VIRVAVADYLKAMGARLMFKRKGPPHAAYGSDALASSRERSGGSPRPWCCLRRCSPSSSRVSRDRQHPNSEAEVHS
jgi:hypothetical protein